MNSNKNDEKKIKPSAKFCGCFKKLLNFIKDIVLDKKEDKIKNPNITNSNETIQVETNRQKNQHSATNAWANGAPKFQTQQQNVKINQSELVETNAWSNGAPKIHSNVSSNQMTNSITEPQSAHIESLKPGILDMAPTKAELENVSLALEKLWLMDDNKLVPEKDFELNLQKYTYVSAQEDKAFEPLFKKTFDETKIFKSKKNFQHFINLLDNYTYLTGVKETNLKSHEKEEELFLSFILKTKPMLYLFHYLCELKIFKKEDLNNGVFLNKLKVVWFQNYKRVVKDDSSAFEHTFVGEIRDGAVIGFHNWVQFYLEEKRGHADYMGYIRPRDRSQKSSASDQILSIHLKWHNVIKPVSTLFIGTSPELEIAMYSLLFFTKNQNVKVTFDNVNLIFKIHTFNSPEGLKLGSCYVETY